MGDKKGTLEEAKSEALAASAAVIALSGETLTAEQARASDMLRAAAVRHLSAALDIVGREKGLGG